MSNIVTTLCRQLRLPFAQKAVLMCLADFAHDDGKDWHSIAAVMEWTCAGRRTVIDALKRLEAAGILRIDRSTGRNSRTHIQLDAIKTLAESEMLLDPCGSRTSAGAAPVQELHTTRAGAAPPPVQEPHQPVREPHPKHQEASVKHQEAKQNVSRKRAVVSEFIADADLPVWLPIEAWRSFTAMRDSLGKPMTVKAEKLAIKHLDQFRGQGHDVERILETSVMNSWQGLFAPSEPPRSVTPTASAHAKPAWALRAGFATVFDAENAGCYERNAHEFAHGRQKEPA